LPNAVRSGSPWPSLGAVPMFMVCCAMYYLALDVFSEFLGV